MSSFLLLLALLVSDHGIAQMPLALPAIPVRLLIPTITLDAHIEAVGPLADRTMGTPLQDRWSDVGWYEVGPRPGQQGSAVIDGQLDRPGGSPAVFWNLRDLHPGAPVTVIDSQGQNWLFRVLGSNYYPYDQVPLPRIFGDASGVYLNLITSAGDWIPSQHQTTLRLVVYTTFVGNQP